jgi:hypothetical protein
MKRPKFHSTLVEGPQKVGRLKEDAGALANWQRPASQRATSTVRSVASQAFRDDLASSMVATTWPSPAAALAAAESCADLSQ